MFNSTFNTILEVREVSGNNGEAACGTSFLSGDSDTVLPKKEISEHTL